MVVPPDPQPLSAHPDGGSGRLRDLLNRRTVPWLLAGVAVYVALVALLPPPVPVWLVVVVIGGGVLRREKRVGRARLVSAALSRRAPATVQLSDVVPLDQDAVTRSRGRVLAALILVPLFVAALVASAWVIYLADKGTWELVVAVAASVLGPAALSRPVLDLAATWRQRATLGPESPRRLVTVVGFLPAGGLVLADGVIDADQVTAALTQGTRSDRLRLTADGTPAALAVAPDVHGTSDLVPGDTLVCHGPLEPGQTIALSSATRTYWPGILRAL